MRTEAALEKLEVISHLPDRWDSYNAVQPDPYCVARAGYLLHQWEHLDVSEVTPTETGGIQIGWYGPPAMMMEIEPKDEP